MGRGWPVGRGWPMADGCLVATVVRGRADMEATSLMNWSLVWWSLSAVRASKTSITHSARVKKPAAWGTKLSRQM